MLKVQRNIFILNWILNLVFIPYLTENFLPSSTSPTLLSSHSLERLSFTLLPIDSSNGHSLRLLFGRLQHITQRASIARHKSRLVRPRHRYKGSRIGVARNGMVVHIVVLLNLEAVEKSHVDEVELAVGQQRASAHAVADAVCEQRRVRLLEPPLGAEDLGVGPHFRVYGVLVEYLKIEAQGEVYVLPMLQAHALRKMTDPLGMTVCP